MESTRKLISVWLSLALMCFLVGCTSTPETPPTKLENQVTNENTTPENFTSKNFTSNEENLGSQVSELSEVPSSSPGSYEDMIAQSTNMQGNYPQLKTAASSYADNNYPSDSQERHKTMTVATIAAGAHYLDGDKKNAIVYSRKARDFSGESGIIFPASWQGDLTADKSVAEAQKVARMKDFIISTSNEGLEPYKKGSSFFQAAQYPNTIINYRQGLGHGLADEELRLICYVRLAASLYKVGNLEEARNTFLHSWLVFPDQLPEKLNSSVNFGDGATRSYLNDMLEDFKDK